MTLQPASAVAAVRQAGLVSTLSDLLALTKPGITTMAVFVAAGALALAPAGLPLSRALLALLGIGLIVGAANALNMVIERDADKLMTRTQGRPMPAGRMAWPVALTFGIVLAAIALVLIALFANLLTLGLAAIALVNYVGIYTPLKRRTPLALIVGAPSGAMPVLMGWTAATGRIDSEGLGLFLVLFAWQLPHFVAISLFRREEYARAGMRVVSVVHSDRSARWQTVAYAGALVAASLSLPLLGVGGAAYLGVALAVNGWFAWLCVRGLRAGAGENWARQVFQASLVYLPVLAVGLALDALR